ACKSWDDRSLWPNLVRGDLLQVITFEDIGVVVDSFGEAQIHVVKASRLIADMNGSYQREPLTETWDRASSTNGLERPVPKLVRASLRANEQRAVRIAKENFGK